MTEFCKSCGLAHSHCLCARYAAAQHQAVSTPLFVLLVHFNEPGRPTNTGRLIRHLLPDTLWLEWQRNQPLPALDTILADPELEPWLVFPGDRPELAPRVQEFTKSPARRPVFIMPEGTWKEVRKIVRKTPQLAGLPLLQLSNLPPSDYTLRRNPDAEHLCTAEVGRELLHLADQPYLARALDQRLQTFMQHYRAWQHHQPVPAHSNHTGSTGKRSSSSIA